jgi:amino acid transporter
MEEQGYINAAPGSLHRGQLSNGAVLFQSISQIAPAGGIATVAILGANFAGGAFPLATLLSVIACLFVALSVSELAKHLPSAGSLGTYVTRSLGGATGYVTGWMYSISEMLIVSFVSLLIGALVSGVMNSEFGWAVKPTWILTVIAIYALTALVHELGVSVSTRVQQVISVVEILLFVVLSLVLITKAGSANTLTVFGTSHGNIPGFKGLGGLFPAAVFIITAFGGFETAASLAEEARQPRQAVRTAVIGAVVGIGALYLLTSYAATVYFGPDKMGGFAAFNAGDPWTGMTREVWGVGWVALFLIVVNSLYGACTAATTVTTRMMLSMSRAGLYPPVFGRVGRRGSPSNALALVSGVGLALALWLGLQYGPITGLSIMVVTSTSMYVTIYILVNLACATYFLRHRRAEHNWWRHVVAPLLGALAFVPVLMVQLGIPVFSFISKLAAPLTYGAYAAIAIVVAGIAVAVYFSVKAPERLARLGRVFDDGTAPEPVASEPRRSIA